MDPNNSDLPIGRLLPHPLSNTAHCVVCRDCWYKYLMGSNFDSPFSIGSRIWYGNIFPYRQTCYYCRSVLVQGADCGDDTCEHGPENHTHWCELHPRDLP